MYILLVRYYKGTQKASSFAYPESGNDGDFGLDHYEPEFTYPRGTWLELNKDNGYNVKLTLTNDTSFTNDIFYFWYVKTLLPLLIVLFHLFVSLWALLLSKKFRVLLY